MEKFREWHQSRVGLLVMGAVEFLASYILASRAIDTGSWWEYGFAIVFAVGGIHNFIKLAGKLFRGKPKTSGRTRKN